MKDLIVKGAIYRDGEMKNGKYSILRDKFVAASTPSDLEGTLIEAPINFHTHLGDSFISSEPEGSLAQIVGPGGFKLRALNQAPASVVKGSMKRSIDFMKNQGTLAFFDFRESGMKGLNLVPKFNGITGFFLTRPATSEEIPLLLDKSAGFGMSALSDDDPKYLKVLANSAHQRKKIFAIHFSENKREDVKSLLDLKPDYIVHCIETTDSDLKALSRSGIPVTITPRSNVFHGKKPDYSRLFRFGLTVLLGTDNAFITEPSIMEEVEFLYRYQRKLNRLSPEEALSTVIDNPRRVISKLRLKINQEKYLFFPDEVLTPYQLVTRPNFYEKITVLKEGNRISFFPRKH